MRYRSAGGRPTDAAAFVDDMSLWNSLRRLLREPDLSVEVVFCTPLLAIGRTRRQLAALAERSIGAALGLPEWAAEDSRGRLAGLEDAYARSLVIDGEIDFRNEMVLKPPTGTIRMVDGRPRNRYPIGAPLLSLPL